MAFSAMLQKNGIKTYVPPHPKDNKDLWGSNPETANKYGSEASGISVMKKEPDFWDSVLQYFIEDMGFLTINNR
jgi:hypothetical protein